MKKMSLSKFLRSVLGSSLSSSLNSSLSFVLAAGVGIGSSQFAKAQEPQKRVDLDDVEIRGEAQNKGMSVLSKTKNNLENRIPLRKDYHTEIVEELPEGFSSTKDKDE